MLDAVGTIVLGAVIALNITAFAGALPARAGIRLAVAAGAGAWTGLAAIVAVAGNFSNTGTPFPVIGVFVVLPLLIAGGLAFFSAKARAGLLAVPMRLLVGLNIARVLGGFFLLLALAGRLGGPFPQSAGWGDVITGLLAIPVMGLAGAGAAPKPKSPRKIWLWNALGTLDLVAAVFLGVTSANGSPLQLIHAGPGSASVTLLPWVLIPAVLVPFYLITHGVIFAQLRRA